jgi:integrase
MNPVHRCQAMSKSPAYAYPRPSGFYFCLNVPHDVRPFVKRSQFRYPLETRHPVVARHRASYVAFRCRAMFSRIRSGLMKQFSESDTNDIVRQWLRESVDMLEEWRVDAPAQSREGVQEILSDLAKAEAGYRAELGRGDYHSIERHAERLLDERGLTYDRDSHAFRKLCRELLKASIKRIQIEQQRSKGEYDDLPDVGPALPAATALAAAAPTSDSTISITKLFEEYEREMVAGKRWRDKTRLEHKAMLGAFVELMGDLPAGELNKAKARDYKTQLQKYPVNRHKDPRYRDKTISEIRALKKVDALSVTTVNNHLIKISGMARWAVDQGYLSSNPFENLTIRTGTRAKEDVLPFSKADLEAIFRSRPYQEGAAPKPYQFWLPLLGLFTGARIEELCQLHLEDIREQDGIWVFDINDGPGRTLKSKASKRLVPIHQELIRLGLLNFAQSLRNAKKTLLFPELSPVGGKHSHYPSIWFGNLKRSLGMPSRRKVFHSFRHTLSDKLREVHALDHEIKLLLGHEVGSVTHDVYGSQPVKALNEVLAKVDFGIDLNHLKSKP